MIWMLEASDSTASCCDEEQMSFCNSFVRDIPIYVTHLKKSGTIAIPIIICPKENRRATKSHLLQFRRE